MEGFSWEVGSERLLQGKLKMLTAQERAAEEGGGERQRNQKK